MSMRSNNLYIELSFNFIILEWANLTKIYLVSTREYIGLGLNTSSINYEANIVLIISSKTRSDLSFGTC